MTRLRRSFVLLLVSLSCALFATGCDGIISDPNFHTWCGDLLCSWKLESGEIRKAPTWHKKDFGVELLDSNAPNHITAISQKVDKSPTCLEFSVIADVAAEAQVSIGVDFDADGTLEYEQPLAALGFREQKTQITAPPNYLGIKFTITKKGSGRAVLAQMDVRSKDGACTAPPVQLKPQIIGTRCSLLGDERTTCLSGVCCEGYCAECCVSPSPPRDEDGGLAPDPENTCSDGAKCDRLPLVSFGELPAGSIGVGDNAIPRQCDPGVRKREAGKECLLAQDCTSGFCDGAAWTLQNVDVKGGVCAAPPLQDPNCNVFSAHAGRCR